MTIMEIDSRYTLIIIKLINSKYTIIEKNYIIRKKEN